MSHPVIIIIIIYMINSFKWNFQIGSGFSLSYNVKLINPFMPSVP